MASRIKKEITARMSKKSIITSMQRLPTPTSKACTNIRRRNFLTLRWLKKIESGAADAPEFEIEDTGIFTDSRYFDVFAEYARNDVDDILIRLTVVNRGPDTAALAAPSTTLVPQHVELGPRE